MSKTARKTKNSEARTNPARTSAVPLRGLAVLVESELWSFITHVGMQVLGALLEQERSAICGAPYARGDARAARRNTSISSFLAEVGREDLILTKGCAA